MLDEGELGAYLRQATSSLFRLETLAVYDVPIDRGDFPRYLAGEAGPDMERKGRWLDFLRQQRAQGIVRHRVRVLRPPLSDYDRYACEWGYAFNVPAGDDTRVLDLAERPLSADLLDHDFWLVDHERPVRMHYDDAGRFHGATVVDPAELGYYQAARDATWHAAEPFDTWWARHPEYHRAAGVGQIEAARRAGTSQNKVSRVENGKGLLTVDEAAALLTVYGVHAVERRRIMTLVEAARAGHIDSRVILQRGAHHFQERIRQLDEQSKLVRSYAPTAVLGILQTRAYAQVVFTQRMTEEQAAPSIASRMERHRILDDPNRQWVLLQAEGALRWNLGGSAVMTEQIERISAAIDRPNVRLGIIPWQTPARVHGFHLYDHRAVVVGTRSGTAIIGEQDVPDYEALFSEVENLATLGR